MPKLQPEIESFARIKVIGVGGSGKNATNHMVRSQIKGVEFIAINTDAQDLLQSLAKKKIHIGKNLTRGLGAGMNPEIGKHASEETIEEIQSVVKNADMVFVTCGMGGGTGTGAAPVIAKKAREAGALTIGVVTKPFFFEGMQRMRIAEEGIENLSNEVDALITIPNDRLLATTQKETTLENAFAMCDDVLRRAVEGISDLIKTPGRINADFADIKKILKDAGSALIGIGFASGEKRAEEAARAAINSPLLDLSINGARGVLFAIAGGDDLTLSEVNEAAKIITESIDPEATVIWGTVNDSKLNKKEIKITVIASGFPENGISKSSSLFGNNTITKTQTLSPKKEPPHLSETEDKKYSSEANKINNSLIAPVLQKSEEQKNKMVADADDDDWAAIPAFLRRKKDNK